MDELDDAGSWRRRPRVLAWLWEWHAPPSDCPSAWISKPNVAVQHYNSSRAPPPPHTPHPTPPIPPTPTPPPPPSVRLLQPANVAVQHYESWVPKDAPWKYMKVGGRSASLPLSSRRRC